MAEDYITRNRCNRPEKLRMRRRILSGNREIPDFGENPLAMVLPGALDFARVDVGHHVGVAQRLGKLPLEVVRHPVGVLQEVLAADNDVEVHVLLRAGAARAQFVIVDHEGPVAVDDVPDLLHRFMRKAAVHQVVQRLPEDGKSRGDDVAAHDQGRPGVQPPPPPPPHTPVRATTTDMKTVPSVSIFPWPYGWEESAGSIDFRMER